MLLTAAPSSSKAFFLFGRLEKVSDNLYLNLEWFFKIYQWNQISCRLHATLPRWALGQISQVLLSSSSGTVFTKYSMTQIAQFLSWILFTLNQTDAIFAVAEPCAHCVLVDQKEGRLGHQGKAWIYQIHMSGANRALCWALCCEKEERTWL